MKKNHINEIRYLIFIFVPRDKINKCPSLSSMWEGMVQSLLPGSSRASKDAGTIWLVSNRTYCFQEDAFSSCSVPQLMTLLPVPIMAQEAALFSPEGLTDFTFSVRVIFQTCQLSHQTGSWVLFRFFFQKIPCCCQDSRNPHNPQMFHGLSFLLHQPAGQLAIITYPFNSFLSDGNPFTSQQSLFLSAFSFQGDFTSFLHFVLTVK